jgi:hypothetical protein
MRSRLIGNILPAEAAGLSQNTYPRPEEIRAHNEAATRLLGKYGDGVVRVVAEDGTYWGSWWLSRNWCREAVAVPEVDEYRGRAS